MKYYLSFVLFLVALSTAYFAIRGLFQRDKNELRVKKIVTGGYDLPNEERDEEPLALLLKPFLILTGVNLDKQRDVSAQLAKAGYSSKSSLIYFLFFMRFIQPALLLVGVLFFAKIYIFDKATAGDNPAVFLAGLVLIVIGGFGSKLFIKNSVDKRTKELSKTFADALDLLLICVESGLGVDAALARVCKEMKDSHPIVAAEFERTRFEITMLNDRVQALQNFGDRTGLAPIRSLVSSLIQAEKFGTSLVDTLRMISDEQRSDRMMVAEEKAARLPALITLPLMFCILPALFIVILGPIHIKLEAQGGIFGGESVDPKNSGK